MRIQRSYCVDIPGAPVADSAMKGSQIWSLIRELDPTCWNYYGNEWGQGRGQVQMLAPQKPISRPGWWKGKFALFQVLATVGWGWWISVQRLTPSPDKQRVRAFIDRVGDALRYRNNIVISNSHLQLVISGLISIILGTVLGTVNLQFWGTRVPISLQLILRIMAAQVLVTV